MMARLATALLATAALAGCGIGPEYTEEGEICVGVATAYDGSAGPAYATTVGGVRQLTLAAEGEGTQFDGLPDDAPAVLCYIDAVLELPPAGTAPRDRAVVAVVDGQQFVIRTGYRDDLPVEEPAKR
jgi:hypothetical protein